MSSNKNSNMNLESFLPDTGSSKRITAIFREDDSRRVFYMKEEISQLGMISVNYERTPNLLANSEEKKLYHFEAPNLRINPVFLEFYFMLWTIHKFLQGLKGVRFGHFPIAARPVAQLHRQLCIK